MKYGAAALKSSLACHQKDQGKVTIGPGDSNARDTYIANTRESRGPHKHVYTDVHSSITHGGQNMHTLRDSFR